MSALLEQLTLVAVVSACFLAPLMLSVSFLLWRKRRARARRRSPIGIDLLRSPGHSIREQLESVQSDISGDAVLTMTLPLLVLSMFLAQAHLRGLDQMRHLAPIYIVFGLGFVGIMLVRMWRAAERLDRLKTGFDAELAVGQQLDQLMRQGAHVFHDIPADHFNIDHVVIASTGVFAVETKGVTKATRLPGKAGATVSFDGKALRFPTWTTVKPIEQAERQASWLAQWLTSAAGVSVRVQPIVALPGWFVDRTGRGPVRVFNGKELAGLLESRGTQPLSATDIRQVVHQIDQRCRTVAPKYAETMRVT